MFSFCELLAMCMLDGIMLLTSPRLEDTKLLVPCDAKRYGCALMMLHVAM